jgi:DNA-binding beta-propeller fold protein YncE
VATVPTGNIGLGLDIAPNGSRVYVATFPISGSGSTPYVSMIDTATNTAIGSIGGLASFPSDVGVTPDGTRAYVIASTTAVINTATNTPITSLSYPATGSSIDFTPDGSRAYIATYGDVGIVNAQTNTIVGSIVLTEGANGRAGSVAIGPGPLRTLSAR